MKPMLISSIGTESARLKRKSNLSSCPPGQLLLETG
jgi:hypothetical protein